MSILSIVSTLSRPPSRRRGFSLVEILVATTLLLIITVVISMVFQQAGGAWSAGTGRANAEGAVRAVLGSIERDLLNAVDAQDYPGSGVPNPEGSGSAIEFLALQHLYDHTTIENSGRTVCRITYDFGSAGDVLRRMTPLEGPNLDLYATEAIINGVPLAELSFTCIKRESDPKGLPLRVDITAAASHSSSFFTISGRSSGVNKKFEDWTEKKSDDIRVGGKL